MLKRAQYYDNVTVGSILREKTISGNKGSDKRHQTPCYVFSALLPTAPTVCISKLPNAERMQYVVVNTSPGDNAEASPLKSELCKIHNHNLSNR
jgi:hypothetical protein